MHNNHSSKLVILLFAFVVGFSACRSTSLQDQRKYNVNMGLPPGGEMGPTSMPVVIVTEPVKPVKLPVDMDVHVNTPPLSAKLPLDLDIKTKSAEPADVPLNVKIETPKAVPETKIPVAVEVDAHRKPNQPDLSVPIEVNASVADPNKKLPLGVEVHPTVADGSLLMPIVLTKSPDRKNDEHEVAVKVKYTVDESSVFTLPVKIIPEKTISFPPPNPNVNKLVWLIIFTLLAGILGGVIRILLAGKTTGQTKLLIIIFGIFAAFAYTALLNERGKLDASKLAEFDGYLYLHLAGCAVISVLGIEVTLFGIYKFRETFFPGAMWDQIDIDPQQLLPGLKKLRRAMVRNYKNLPAFISAQAGIIANAEDAARCNNKRRLVRELRKTTMFAREVTVNLLKDPTPKQSDNSNGGNSVLEDGSLANVLRALQEFGNGGRTFGYDMQAFLESFKSKPNPSK